MGKMRMKIIIIGASLAVMFVVSCVPPPPPPPPHRQHYRYHRHKHCRSECVRWKVKRRCFRRCRLRGPMGRCVSWDRVCRRKRVCRQHATRCR